MTLRLAVNHFESNMALKREAHQLWFFPELRTRRESARLTQQALAALTKKHDPDGFGVSKETISRMERTYGASRRLALILFDAISEALAQRSGERLDPDTELTTTHPRGGSGVAA